MASNMILRIESLGHRGVGIGRHQGKVVMVPLSAPGDLLELRLTDSHSTYDEAEIVRILEASPHRRTPPCPYFGRCGGCQLQHLDPQCQRFQKQRILRQMLGSQSQVEENKVLDLLWGTEEFGYRCRVDLHVSWEGAAKLGFARSRSSSLIFIRRCMVAMEKLNGFLPAVRELLGSAGATSVKRLEIACGTVGEDFTLFMTGAMPVPKRSLQRLAEFCGRIPGLRALWYGRAPGGQARRIWRSSGPWEGVLMELELPNLEGQLLEAWPGVFTQVNPQVNRLLVQTLLSWVRELRPRRVLDLYAGVGNLSIPLATVAEEVVAVEVDPRAVHNGIANCNRLGISNIRWVRQSAANALSGMSAHGDEFDLVVMDPPRSGAKELLGPLAALRPQAIIYISCDPATLARDLGRFQRDLGYTVERVQPLDMFPQTFHIESLSLILK